MKNKIMWMVIAFLSLMNTLCNAQCNNELANKQFEKDLESITRSVENSNINLKDVPSIVERIESVSLIEP